jgi:HAMP domain-containing protein
MTPTVKAFDAGDSGEGEIQKSTEASGFVMDETTVTAFARTAGAAFYREVPGFEGFGWTVTVKQPTALALAPLASLGDLHAVLSASATHVGRVLVAAVLLGGLGAAALATILARGITRPLARLADASESVSRGDSIASIDIRSDDEIGDLGASFERLVASVRFLMQEERTTETR